jgi:hypothetical protein
MKFVSEPEDIVSIEGVWEQVVKEKIWAKKEVTGG